MRRTPAVLEAGLTPNPNLDAPARAHDIASPPGLGERLPETNPLLVIERAVRVVMDSYQIGSDAALVLLARWSASNDIGTHDLCRLIAHASDRRADGPPDPLGGPSLPTLLAWLSTGSATEQPAGDLAALQTDSADLR